MQQLGEPGDIPSHFLLIRGCEITSCLLLVVNVRITSLTSVAMVCSVQLQVKSLNQYERNHDLILTPYLEMMFINHYLTLISVIHVSVCEACLC